MRSGSNYGRELLYNFYENFHRGEIASRFNGANRPAVTDASRAVYAARKGKRNQEMMILRRGRLRLFETKASAPRNFALCGNRKTRKWAKLLPIARSLQPDGRQRVYESYRFPFNRLRKEQAGPFAGLSTIFVDLPPRESSISKTIARTITRNVLQHFGKGTFATRNIERRNLFNYCKYVYKII